MKILKLTAVFMALCLSLSVQAICPPDVQKTAIFYINGVANYTESQAASSKDELEQRLKAHPKYNPDCVTVDLAYNQDELFIGDIIESAAQKSEELVIPLSHAIGMLFRVVLPDTWFGDVIANVYERNTSIVDPAQRDEHLAKYRPLLDAGTQVILVSHSQGGLFANDEWNSLTPLQQLDTHIVTVVTPAFSTADGGPNTRIKEDLIAKLFFPLAPLPDPPDFSNIEPCADTLLSALTLVRCHSFIESYMQGTNSRTKIVNDIVSLLPTAPVATSTLFGHVILSMTNNLIQGAKVTLCNPDTAGPCLETTSGSAGEYRFSGIEPCSRCLLIASKNLGSGFFFRGHVNNLEIPPGETVEKDIVVILIRPF